VFARLRSILAGLAGRRRFEDGMADELRFHLDQYSSELRRQGLSPEEATRRARLAFGSLDNVKDDCREARGLRLVDDLGRHVRDAVRVWRKSPGFTAGAVATIGICLGANLAIFALVDAILLRPLPFADAGRLVRVFNTYPNAGVLDDGASVTNYYERRGRIAAFSSLAIYRPSAAIVGDAGSTERDDLLQVSPDFFATLGRGPVMGRGFTDAEMTPGADHVVVVSDAFWRERLQADPGAVGRVVRVDGAPRTVVGVLPRDFSFLSSDAQLYLPLSSRPAMRGPAERHSGNSIDMVARLAPGATVAGAEAQIAAQNHALAASYPGAEVIAASGFHTVVVPLRADHVASVRPALLLLQAGALFLLLIGAVNLANLLLIRASGRQKELAVRRALGASRGDVVRAVLVETVVLTLAGGVVGIAGGAAGIRALAALGADELPLGAYVTFDVWMATAGLAGAFLLGLLIGAPIAWVSARRRSGMALRADSRSATGGRAVARLRHGFLVAQVALAFTLLAGTGLLALSLEHVMAVSPGFRPDHLLSGHLTLPGPRYPTGAAVLEFSERLTDALRAQPGVEAAGVVTNVPLSGRNIKSAVTVEGYVPRPGGSARGHYGYGVGGDYFAAMGVSLVAGRALTADDARGGARVCVVDEDFARHYFAGGSPIGHRLFQGPAVQPESQAFTIVGVVAPMKQAALTEDAAQGAVFFPFRNRLDNQFYVLVRTKVEPASTASTLRRIVRSLDPELPVNDVESMDARIAGSLVARRSPALLAGFFSCVAVLLTAIGIYGVISYAVAERRREIALRMALGASPRQVRAGFLSLAWRLTAAGTVLGLAGAWLAGRLMRAALFDTPAFDAGVIAATMAITGAVALAACLVPSARAARVPPIEALNHS
jgi:putative ABC transport system permease protein